MKKRIFFAIVLLIVVAGILGGIKYLQIDRMMAQGKQFAPPPATVNVTAVKAMDWESRLTAVGSLRAVQGVTVTAELTGRVDQIAFIPGGKVDAGDLLVQQDVSFEQAQLRAAEAARDLARANHSRAQELRSEQVVTQAAYEQALASLKQAQAEIERIQATIDKKTIEAPFSGRLGIRQVDLGQIINEGDPIVSLQAMNPIFVNFQLPQNQIGRIQPGLTVRIRSDSLPGEVIEGRITALNPQVEEDTLNIRIQATVENLEEKLRPGMFVNVDIVLPEQEKVLAIPSTAVVYAPYSDSVFIVETPPAEKEGPDGLVLRQQFIRLGAQRGDYVVVTSGLQPGDNVVSTGVFKYRNGQKVVVDNTLAPEFSLSPKPADR
jgi:membrane fusion protein (multidrug efflux system)